ncbi:hypothetical protein SCHPADRAFT_562195 [Schizopora paradoxa]|uniref:G-protein coupled receptors family 1 profile domain-containing protein n=1 Tax=Schizopora paradoxa TaxID=27342 RepID=A0A0H2RDE3_9AGAM|nr:hypothetical protein SCHPADRAFT_562195 [Schizopora paradoxa]
MTLIWKTNWSMGKVLYLACRYPPWVLLITSLILPLKTDCSIKVMLMSIRTYATYNGSVRVKWFIIVFFTIEQLTVIAMNGVLTALSEFSKFPLKGASCFLEASKYPKGAAVVLFAGGAAYDVITSWMLFARLFSAVRQGNSRLAWIIFKNGLAYFLVVTTYCIAELFLFLILPDDQLLLPSAMSFMLTAIASVLSSRLILHLRAFACQYELGGDLMTMDANPARSRSIVFANANRPIGDSIDSGDEETVEDIEGPIVTISRAGISV